MKSILSFLRTTITGGILFLLPVVLVVTIFIKIQQVLLKISAPLARRLPDIFFGIDGSEILAILLLILLCFLCGLLFKTDFFKKIISTLEDKILSFLPGYSLMKSIASDSLDKGNKDGLKAVIVQDEDKWNIGFLVEEAEGLCTVFIPEAPQSSSGEIKIVPSARVKKIDQPANKVSYSIKNFGKGAIGWLKKN
jgi:uncharacterized membrane protein